MKRYFALLLIAFSFLFLAGCLGKEEHPTPGKEAPVITETGSWSAEVEQPENETGPAAPQDWAAQALLTKNPSYCLKLPPQEQDPCRISIANDSLEACRQVLNQQIREDCIIHHAYLRGDISLCDLAAGEKKVECIKKLSPPCTFIVEITEKARCYAFEYRNYTYCKDENCSLDYAFAFREEGACMMLSNSTGKMEGCLSALQFTDRCKNLPTSHKELCYYTYALGTNNPLFCYNIENDQSKIAYQCFTHFAIANHNDALCQAIFVLDRWNCYMEYALTTGDKNGCYDIDVHAPDSREICFREYAYAHDDATACNEMTTEYMRQICFSSTIFGAHELTLQECSGIRLPEWQDKCFQELAKRTGEKTFCNYIGSETVKYNCDAYFG
ncbi:MAG: hypothetical protein QXH30_01945 [Candidatus Bilamarchaeaceae archaeon]